MKKILFLFLAFFALTGNSCDVNNVSDYSATIETNKVIEQPFDSADLIEEKKSKTIESDKVSENDYDTVEPTVTPSYAPNGTYTNTSGNEVPSPYYAPSAPAGASAQCRDGTYSFSQSRRGTCSHHGGVAEWY